MQVYRLALFNFNALLMENTYINEVDLAALAKNLREERGLTQEKAADLLGVSQPTLSQAENNADKNLTKLRIKMIREFGGIKIDGPFYKLDL